MSKMGELLDALNAANSKAAPPNKSAVEQAAELFRFPSQKVMPFKSPECLSTQSADGHGRLLCKH